MIFYIIFNTQRLSSDPCSLLPVNFSRKKKMTVVNIISRCLYHLAKVTDQFWIP